MYRWPLLLIILLDEAGGILILPVGEGLGFLIQTVDEVGGILNLPVDALRGGLMPSVDEVRGILTLSADEREAGGRDGKNRVCSLLPGGYLCAMEKEKAIRIQLPVDFSFRECLWFLDRNYDDCLHRLKEDGIVKAIRVDGRVMLVSVHATGDSLLIEMLHDNTDKVLRGDIDKVLHGGKDKDWRVPVEQYVKNWLDLERNIGAFYALLNKDKRLAYMSGDYRGLRLVGIVDLFEALCWSIIGQQINLRFAYTLKRRLVEKYGTALEYEGERHYLFPTFAELAEVSVTDLRAMQFSESKAKYLIGVAGVFARGELSMDMLAGLPDMESRQKALMQLKGIGIWTANYCLMKTLREPSCIPYGDTGLLTALANHGIIKERKEAAKIDRFFSKYAGWESYLVFYLWRSLSDPR